MSDETKTKSKPPPFEDTFWRDLLEASFRIKREHRRLGKLLGIAFDNNSQRLAGGVANPTDIPTAKDPCQVLVHSMIVLEFVAKILRDSARETGNGGQGPASQAAAAAPPSDGDSP